MPDSTSRPGESVRVSADHPGSETDQQPRRPRAPAGSGAPRQDDSGRIRSDRRAARRILAVEGRHPADRSAQSRSTAGGAQGAVRDAHPATLCASPRSSGSAPHGDIPTALVHHEGGSLIVGLAEDVEVSGISIGQHVLLNNERNLLLGVSPYPAQRCGETAVFSRSLSGRATRPPLARRGSPRAERDRPRP